MRVRRFSDTTASAICEGVATARALGVYLRLKYECWDELAVMAISPNDYVTPEAYYADRIVVDLLRKDASLPTSFDRKAEALKNFWIAEHSCYRANERLAPYLEGRTHPDHDEALARFMRVLRKNVRLLIGSEPPDYVPGRFGPGSTYGDKGQNATLPDKMQSRPTVNNGGTRWLQEWSVTAWGKACAAAKRDEVIVRGNRFLTVPKDCRKDRGIAVEPSINVFYQLALGRALRHRLARSGVNLDYAQDIHRQVACEASKEGHMSTIDLSNASDTVCANFVKLALPDAWYEELNSLRSTHTLVGNHWVLLEKFSSMGNGYTFELETVLFMAICCAVLEIRGDTPLPGVNIHVFGDDIIVPSQYSEDVLAALNFLGFKPNEDKTFVNGPFRESCGGDYFLGADVRPHYIKEDVTEPQHFIALANALWRLREKLSDDSCNVSLRRALLRARFKCLDQLPIKVRSCKGPSHLGDLVIHDHENTWRPRVRHSIRYFDCYAPVKGKAVSWKYFDGDVVLATALYLAGSRQASGDSLAEGVQPRDNISGYKIKLVPSS